MTDIPDIRVQFSVHVSLQNRHHTKEDMSPYKMQIMNWYVLGSKDFRDITEFEISYNKKGNWFDISYITNTISEERDMHIADPDVDGYFPILINGEQYNVVGQIVITDERKT
jgi:hypothetical protein